MWCGGHFVVEADDGEAVEGDGVFGAENGFVVHVDVEKLVERFDVPNAPVVGAGGNNAIEAGAASGGAGRVQPKRAIGMSDGKRYTFALPLHGKVTLTHGWGSPGTCTVE